MSAALRLSGLGQITDYLYISSRKATKDSSALSRFGISCIINATPDRDTAFFPSAEYVQVPVADCPEAKLNDYFDAVSDKIDRVRAEGGRVLVHCNAGVSRSAALCLAYLVKYVDLSLRDAYLLVKAHRPIIRPNSGFWEQLIEYERNLRGTSSVTMVMSALGPIPDLYEKEINGLIPL